MYATHFICSQIYLLRLYFIYFLVLIVNKFSHSSVLSNILHFPMECMFCCFADFFSSLFLASSVVRPFTAYLFWFVYTVTSLMNRNWYCILWDLHCIPSFVDALCHLFWQPMLFVWFQYCNIVLRFKSMKHWWMNSVFWIC